MKAETGDFVMKVNKLFPPVGGEKDGGILLLSRSNAEVCFGVTVADIPHELL